MQGSPMGAVVAREDSAGEKRLVAYYVAAEDCGSDREDSAGNVRARSPSTWYLRHMCRWTSLPLTVNGKVDRKALPAPAETAYSQERHMSRRRVRWSRRWRESGARLLAVERVGRHDNFFELGGHSLLAVRVLSRVRAELQAELS